MTSAVLDGRGICNTEDFFATLNLTADGRGFDDGDDDPAIDLDASTLVFSVIRTK